VNGSLAPVCPRDATWAIRSERPLKRPSRSAGLMNPVEIEEAVSELAAQRFDDQEFPFAFLTAFGNKETTVKR